MINKIIKNSVVVYSNTLVTSVLAIVIIPIILSSVSQEQYGLVVLSVFLSVRNGIFGIFMFGIQATVIKFVAEYRVTDEHFKIANLLGFSILSYALISAVLVFTLLGIKHWLFGVFFKVPHHLLDGYLAAFDYVLISIFFQFFSLIILGYFEGSHKFFVSKLIDTLSYATYFLSVSLCLSLGYGFLGIVKLLGLMHVLTFVFCLVALKMTKLGIRPTLSFNRKTLITWLKYCRTIFLANLAAVVFNHSPRLLVSTAMSPSALAIYDILSKLPASVKSFVGLGNRVIVPVASELGATAKSDTTYKLFTIGLKLNLLLFLPFIASLAILSESILFVWVGSNYVQYADLMRILYLVPALSIFISFGFSILLGTNRKLVTFPIFSWGILILSCLYWYYRVDIDGLMGMIIGRVFGLAVITPLALAMFINHFKVRAIELFLRIMALVVSLLIPMLLLELSLAIFSFEPLVFLLVMSPVLYTTYFAAIYVCIFDKGEQSLIVNFMQNIRFRAKSL